MELNTKRAVAAISAFLRAQSNEPQELAEVLGEVLWAAGSVVFKYEWDGGGMVHSGAHSIVTLGEAYFAHLDEEGWGGPYRSLDDALIASEISWDNGSVKVSDVTTEIWCAEWSDDALIARLDLQSFDLPQSVVLNDTKWLLDDVTTKQQHLAGSRVLNREQHSLPLDS